MKMKKCKIKLALETLKAVAEVVGDCGADEGTKQYEKDLYELRCLCSSIVKTITWYENSCNNYDNCDYDQSEVETHEKECTCQCCIGPDKFTNGGL